MKKPDFSKAEVGDHVWYYSSDGDMHKVKVMEIDSNYLYAKDGPLRIKVRIDGVFDGEALPSVFWQPLPEFPEECLNPPKRIRQETRRVWVNVYKDLITIHTQEDHAVLISGPGVLAVAVPVDIPYTVEEDR